MLHSDGGGEWMRQRHHPSYHMTPYHQNDCEAVILRQKKIPNVALTVMKMCQRATENASEL